jgi:hypothetical protein
MQGIDADPGDGRDETSAEKADRKWADVVQELRVIQTGAQITAGFLLTLPFQDRFWGLSGTQHAAFLALVVLSATITALVMAPVAIHRRLSGQHVKTRLVEASSAIVRLVLVCMALLVAGIVALVFDVVVNQFGALIAGGGMLALLFLLLALVPRALVEAE